MKLVTSKGREVETPFTDAQATVELRKRLETMDKRSGGFAASILSAFDRGRASHDQRVWMHILVLGEKIPETEEKIDFTKVNLIFGVAKQKGLIRTRIRLPGLVVRIGYGDKLIAVRMGGGDRKVIAEVRNHELIFSKWARPEEKSELLCLAKDPIEYAKLYGDRSGCCMFCGLTLTTAESVGSGYGPVCAENYGLPWSNSHGAQIERRVRELQRLQELIELEQKKL